MFCKNLFSVISLALFVFMGNTALAACPSADLTGDCFVDYEDFVQMGGQWLNGYDSNDLTEMAIQWLTTDPCVPDDMTYIPDGEFLMGDHFAEGFINERPVHAVLLDAFFMSKYEITNQQYRDYLNSALGSGTIYLSSDVVYGTGNNQGYCYTHSCSSYSQIDYSGGVFSVMTKPEVDGRDMSDDPMVTVSWYGSVAYCNWLSQQEGYEACYDTNDSDWSADWPCDFTKKSYRLPTEAEWEYAARGGLLGKRFPWGDEINHDYANYYANGSADSYDTSPYTTYTFHPDWNDGIEPYTSVVGSFFANGYGLYDMTGNLWEWCNDFWATAYYSTSPYDNPHGPAIGYMGRVLRGGSWHDSAYYCRVTCRAWNDPDYRRSYIGFRIVLDLD
jgi:sulfatase modifying factor 1